MLMFRWMGWSAVLSLLILSGNIHAAAVTDGSPEAGQSTVTGTALYRERILLPPGAIFEAVLQDTARAGAPAVTVGRVTLEGRSGPPFHFAIPYDPAQLDPRARYTVRATITVDGRLWFTSDTVHRVLTGDSPAALEILMRHVPGTSHGLQLPASFLGVLPCADCPGVKHHLDLWPDKVFHLRREWLERETRFDDLGRWHYEPGRRALVLYGGTEMPLQFEVIGPTELRLLDLEGQPIDSELDYSLRTDGNLTPTDLELFFGGDLQYMADAAVFTECLTGRRYPVAMEGDWIQAERAYLEAAPEPGGRLYTTFEGRLTDRPKMEGEGIERSLIVQRFINVWPGQSCPRSLAQADLLETYWRIVRLADEPIRTAEQRREPHLILRQEDNRLSATVGCNHVMGSYELEDGSLRFSGTASTRMACPPPLDAWERALAEVLDKTRRFRIVSQTLELYDEAGRSLASLEAVYLR
jgi:copper homeostasis protein (lipoprotein)